MSTHPPRAGETPEEQEELRYEETRMRPRLKWTDMGVVPWANKWDRQ